MPPTIATTPRVSLSCAVSDLGGRVLTITGFANSIGCFIPAKCISSVAVSATDSTTAYYHVNPAKVCALGPDLLDRLNNPDDEKEAPAQPYTMAQPHEPDTPKFMQDKVVGSGTGFYIGNGLVATAGHCIFAEDGSGRPDDDILSGYFITNFTQGLDDGNNGRIDKAHVFAVKKYVISFLPVSLLSPPLFFYFRLLSF